MSEHCGCFLILTRLPSGIGYCKVCEQYIQGPCAHYCLDRTNCRWSEPQEPHQATPEPASKCECRVGSDVNILGNRHYFVEHCDHCRNLEADATQLGNLLAIIHRDGGHHQDKVGTRQAVLDAHQVWAKLMTENARQAEEIRQLKEQLQFTPAFVDTLGTLGFPERFLEEYREQKMKIRRLSAQLKLAVETLEWGG